jgi:hypothetical protein
MSWVTAAPDLMTTAATDLAGIGSTLSAAHTAAAGSTVAVLPAAADEVSAGIAQLFSAHAQDFQGVAGQASAFHQQFVQNLSAGAASYSTAEAAGAAALQPAGAVASSVAGAAASVNPIGDFIGLLLFPFQYVLAQVQNLIASFLYTYFIGPIFTPIFEAIFTAIFKAIFQALIPSAV